MTPLIQYKNGSLYLDNTPLTIGSVQTSVLSEPAAVGDAQVFLQSYVGFLDNQILLIEGFGTETAEIVTVNGTPNTNDGAVLDSVLVRSHPIGAKVYVLDYNQVELSHATTAAGSKTVLTTTLGSGLVAIQADVKTQIVRETEYTSGYYFARFYNTVTAAYSGYSDPLTYGGWDSNTVGYMIERAFRDVDLTGFTPKVTLNDCLEWINSGLKLVQGKLVRFPGLFEYNYIAGQTQRGVNTITLPTNTYDTETARSIVAVRIGDNKRLSILNPIEYEERVGYVKTQVRTQATSGSTSLAVDNSYDFADSGSVNVYISGTKYNITYTGVTRDTETGGTAALTGIPSSGDGSITVTVPVDTNVWQDEEEGTPVIATVRDGELEYYPLPDSSYDNENIALDYALVATSVDSQSDTIEVQRFDMIQSYLTWRVWCKARNNASLDETNGHFTDFRTRLNDYIRTSPTEVQMRRAPRINRMNRPSVSYRSGTNTTT